MCNVGPAWSDRHCVLQISVRHGQTDVAFCKCRSEGARPTNCMVLLTLSQGDPFHQAWVQVLVKAHLLSSRSEQVNKTRVKPFSLLLRSRSMQRRAGPGCDLESRKAPTRASIASEELRVSSARTRPPPATSLSTTNPSSSQTPTLATLERRRYSRESDTATREGRLAMALV